MKKFVRIMLVAGLMATVAVPYTFISERDAHAAQAVMQGDDAGPLPAWWAQAVYGERSTQAARGGVGSDAPETTIHFLSADSNA